MKTKRVEEGSWFTVTIGGTRGSGRVEWSFETPGSMTMKEVQRRTRNHAECSDWMVDVVRVEGPHECRDIVAKNIRQLQKLID